MIGSKRLVEKEVIGFSTNGKRDGEESSALRKASTEELP